MCTSKTALSAKSQDLFEALERSLFISPLSLFLPPPTYLYIFHIHLSIYLDIYNLITSGLVTPTPAKSISAVNDPIVPNTAPHSTPVVSAAHWSSTGATRPCPPAQHHKATNPRMVVSQGLPTSFHDQGALRRCHSALG